MATPFRLSIRSPMFPLAFVMLLAALPVPLSSGRSVSIPTSRPEVSVLLDQYVSRHRERLQRVAMGGPSEDVRYVVLHRGWYGYGNKFLGTVSALLLALLTDRVLLLDWPDEGFHYVSGALYAPENPVNVTVPAWTNLLQPLPFESRLHMAGFQVDQSEVAYVGVDTTQPDGTDWRLYEELLCGDLDKSYPQRVLVLFMNTYVGPLLEMNPRYLTRMREIFGRDVFGPLARFLFEPSDSVQQRVTQVLKRMEGRFSIGLQIRSSEEWGYSLERVEAFFRCSDLVAPDDSYLVFLATNDPVVRERALIKYGDRLIVSSESVSGRDSDVNSEHAIADMRILSRCDELVVSSGSTFGSFAHGWGSNTPYVVTGGGGKAKEVLPITCQRKLTCQPTCMMAGFIGRFRCFEKHMHLPLNHQTDGLWPFHSRDGSF